MADDPYLPALRAEASASFTVSAFNFLGPIGKAIGEVLMYRIEARRAERRLQELGLRVEVFSRVLDAQTETQLAEIHLRARAIDGALSVASAELAQRAVTGDALIAALKSADEHLATVLASGDASDRRMAMDAKIELARLLADFTLASSSGTLNALGAIQNLAGHLSRDLIADVRRALEQ